MNVLQKGTLTIVAATLVTSAMILFTGNTIADSASRTTSEVSSSANTENINDKAVADVGGVQVTKVKIATPKEIEKASAPPPPGPFLVNSSVNDALAIRDKTKSLIAPTLPETSVKAVAKKKTVTVFPSKPVEPKIVVQQPDMKISKPAIPKQPSKMNITVKELVGGVKPEFKMTRPSIPITSS